MPNHSTVVYESTMSMSNSFECLSDMNERSRSVNSSNDLSMSSIGSPTAASSPKCKQRNPVNPDLSMLRTLTINFQSIKNKVPDLHALIDSAQPHVIIGTETWLTKDMHSPDFFPNEYEVYRRDRPNDPDGGVLIAVNQTLTSSIVFTGNNTEFVSIKINLKHGKSAIICAAYRPPNRTDDEYTNSLINDITSVRSAHKNADEVISTYPTSSGLTDVLSPEQSLQGLPISFVKCKMIYH